LNIVQPRAWLFQVPSSFSIFSSAKYCVGSWDRTISLWDSRASTQPGGYDVGGKVFALAISPSGTKLVVATSTRNILIYDIRNISVPEQEREACLKHQIRAVKVSQDEQGTYGIFPVYFYIFSQVLFWAQLRAELQWSIST